MNIEADPGEKGTKNTPRIRKIASRAVGGVITAAALTIPHSAEMQTEVEPQQEQVRLVETPQEQFGIALEYFEAAQQPFKSSTPEITPVVLENVPENVSRILTQNIHHSDAFSEQNTYRLTLDLETTEQMQRLEYEAACNAIDPSPSNIANVSIRWRGEGGEEIMKASTFASPVEGDELAMYTILPDVLPAVGGGDALFSVDVEVRNVNQAIVHAIEEQDGQRSASETERWQVSIDKTITEQTLAEFIRHPDGTIELIEPSSSKVPTNTEE